MARRCLDRAAHREEQDLHVEVYVDLSKALGPRALESARTQIGEQVRVMARGGQGG